MPKSPICRLSLVLALLLFCLCLVLERPVLAVNRIFFSTNLEGSQSSQLLEFAPAVGGAVDKFKLHFPSGMLGGGVGLVSLLINGKPAKSPTLTMIDPLDANTLIVDVPKTTKIGRGVQIILELMGLTNPMAGDYQIDISLIGKTGSVLESLTPIPLTIVPLAGSGDITAVNAGTGLTGGGLSGDVTLNVNTSVIQQRVSGVCAAGNAVRVVNGDGTVSCESVAGGAGDITAVIAGTGLTGGAASGDATLNVATGGITNALLANNSVDSSKIVDGSIGSGDVNSAQVQQRVSGNCTAGNAIRVIDQSGNVTCEPVGAGGSGWGLTGNSGTHPPTNFLGTTDNQSLVLQTNNGERLRVDTNGNVGIGTNSFPSGLQINTDVSEFNRNVDNVRIGVANGSPTIILEDIATNSTQWEIDNFAGRFRIHNPGDEKFTITSSGNVGIGTTGPLGKLQVVTANDTDPGFVTSWDSRHFVIGGTGDSGSIGMSYDQTNQVGYIQALSPNVAFRNLVLQGFGGNVGIGTDSPSARLHAVATGAPAIRGSSDNGGAGVFGSSSGTGSAGIFGSSTNGIGVSGFSMSGDHFAVVNPFYGTVTVFRVRNDGQVRSDVGFTTPAADFAELLEVDESGGREAERSQPGDVLVISPETGKMSKSNQPYSTMVAGVYSTKPGFLGGQGIKVESPANTVPVALVGVVPTKVSTENGAIHPGDLLTSSSTPGHAMKCTERSQCFGATVGKALERLEFGTGVITVLVTLR